VVEEWEIWDDKDKVTKFEEKTKKLVSQRFYKKSMFLKRKQVREC